MIKIGEFSKLAKTTIKTLRYYDEIGLFKPSFVDENGYRYYEISQLNDLIKIINYRLLDLSIEKIIDIYNGKNKEAILNEHLNYLLKEKKKKLYQISSIRRMLEGGKDMNKFKSTFKTIDSNIVYYRHGKIKSMLELTDFILETGRRCGELNPTLNCINYCYVTYTAKEYKEKDIELEYVEACERKGKEGNGIYFRTDPKIKALTVECKGSYVNLRDAYAYALDQIKKNKLEISGPIREVYIHGCWDCKNEKDYLTEIQIPVSK